MEAKVLGEVYVWHNSRCDPAECCLFERPIRSCSQIPDLKIQRGRKGDESVI